MNLLRRIAYSLSAQDGEIRSRFRQLEAEFLSTSKQPVDQQIREHIDRIIAKGEKEKLAREELLHLEQLVLSVANDNYLGHRLAELAEQFRELGGAKAYELFMSWVKPRSNEGDIGFQRNLALCLHNMLWKMRLEYVSFNNVRVIVSWLFLVLAIVGTVIGVRVYNSAEPSMAVIALSAGAFGGAASAFQRLYTIRWSGELVWLTRGRLRLFFDLLFSLVVSILQGAVFALVFYAACLAGVLSASIFPTYGANPNDSLDPQLWKTIVWSFTAGFSERLIPDYLQQLSHTSKVTRS